MKQETIIQAVKSINRSIAFYQRKLTYQLELKAENAFYNGNLKVDSFGDYELGIAKYEIILADLATIKRAIKKNKTSIKIYGTLKNRSYIYNETFEELRKAGFEVDGDGYGTIELIPVEELEE